MKSRLLTVLLGLNLLWVAVARYLAAHAVPHPLDTRDTLGLLGWGLLVLALGGSGGWALTRPGWASRLGGGLLLLGAGWLLVLGVGFWLMYTAAQAPPTPPPHPCLNWFYARVAPHPLNQADG